MIIADLGLSLLLLILVGLLYLIVKRIITQRNRETLYNSSRVLTEGLELPNSPGPEIDPDRDAVNFGGYDMSHIEYPQEPGRYASSKISTRRDVNARKVLESTDSGPDESTEGELSTASFSTENTGGVASV